MLSWNASHAKDLAAAVGEAIETLMPLAPCPAD